MIAAAVTITPPVSAAPLVTARRLSPGLGPPLVHPADQEDVVVRGQAEHHADDEDGDGVLQRGGSADAEQRLP